MKTTDLLGAPQAANIAAELMPCTNCPNFNRCGTEQMSCDDLGHYYKTGRVRNKHRNPSKQTFLRQQRA